MNQLRHLLAKFFWNKINFQFSATLKEMWLSYGEQSALSSMCTNEALKQKFASTATLRRHLWEQSVKRKVLKCVHV